MKNLAVIFDEFHLKHSPPDSHPEKPERISSVYKYLLEEKFFNEVDLIKPPEAEKGTIISVHTDAHFSFVKNSVENGKTWLDADTYITTDSMKAALLSAGAAVKAVDLVLSKSYKNVFSLMRPPGHHAESNRAMGFCLFNNIAIAAKYAVMNYSLERIAVIDWDVHHGNGTQEIFYDTERIYFISLHQYPLYPGTGASNEKGIGKGEGYTLNFPLPAGTTGEIYLKLFNEEIIPRLEKYNPQLVFISAGFDGHKDDPLASIKLTEEDFSGMTRLIRDFADKKKLSIISLLEGGYNLNALSKSVYAHLLVLNENI